MTRCWRSTSACWPTARSTAPLDLDAAREALGRHRAEGFAAVAIALMHGYRFPGHERALADLARELGFTQVSVSHEVSPLIKLVGRAGTTVADAYLSPVLNRYVAQVSRSAGAGAHRRAAAVHDVVGRLDLAGTLPRPQGRRVVRPRRRRHDRPGPDGPLGRLRPGDRLRHGRHLHRRRPLSPASTSAPWRPKWPACACGRR